MPSDEVSVALFFIENFALSGETSDNELDKCLSVLRQNSPVIWSERLGSWLVVCREGMAHLKDPRLSVVRTTSVELMSADQQKYFKQLNDFYKSWLLLLDPPLHTEVRSVVQPWFTPSHITRHLLNYGVLAERMLGALNQKAELDLVAEFCAPFSARVLLDFIGLTKIETGMATEWSQRFFKFLMSRGPTVEEAELTSASLREIYEQMASSRRNRTGKLGLIHQLPSRIGNVEVELICAGILVDGIGPLTSCVAITCMNCLEASDWKIESLQEKIINNALRKTLELQSPFQYVARRTSGCINIQGYEIPINSRVLFFIGSASQSSTDQLCPSQKLTGRNRNYAYGRGMHSCLGLNLANEVAYITAKQFLLHFRSKNFTFSYDLQTSFATHKLNYLRICQNHTAVA